MAKKLFRFFDKIGPKSLGVDLGKDEKPSGQFLESLLGLGEPYSNIHYKLKFRLVAKKLFQFLTKLAHKPQGCS